MYSDDNLKDDHYDDWIAEEIVSDAETGELVIIDRGVNYSGSNNNNDDFAVKYKNLICLLNHLDPRKANNTNNTSNTLNSNKNID